MRKKLVFIFLLLAFALSACLAGNSDAEGILAFEQSEYSVGVGQSLTVKPIQQDISEWLNLTWESGDETVAKVSYAGYVTPVNEGSTTITCVGKTSGGTKYTASYCLNVYVPIQRMTIDKSEVKLSTLNFGDIDKVPDDIKDQFEYVPEITYYPENATYKTLQWECSAPNAVTIDKNGKITVTGSFIGSATVTGRATDGSNASVQIRVTIPPITTTSPKLVIEEPGIAEIGLICNANGFFQYGTWDNPYAIYDGDRSENGITWIKIRPLKAGQTSLNVWLNGESMLSVPIIVEHSALYDSVSYPPKTVDQIVKNLDASIETKTQFNVKIIEINEIDSDEIPAQMLYVGNVQSNATNAYVAFWARRGAAKVDDVIDIYGTIADVMEYTSPTGLRYQMPVLKDVHIEK